MSLSICLVSVILAVLGGLSESLSLGIREVEGSARVWRMPAPLTGIRDLSRRLTSEAGLLGGDWREADTETGSWDRPREGDLSLGGGLRGASSPDPGLKQEVTICTCYIYHISRILNMPGGWY